ncbi:MAG: copper-translocating P-type ATPase [Campylobacter sp.]|nr:copper-translocating P-type ATPase [Campylobacter sp.]
MSEKIRLNIVGMTCVNCSNAVERVTKKIDGVLDVNVSFASGYGEFDVVDKNLESTIQTKIEKLGYEVATNYEDLISKKRDSLNLLKNKLILATILTIIIMYLHMVAEHNFINSLLQFFLSGIVVFFCGSSFFTHAVGALKNKSFDMNVLVALGSSVAFLYSAFIFLFPNLVDVKFANLYFESAAMIVTFILFGRFLEWNSKAKANDYIKTLLDLTPKMAFLVKADGTTDEILATDLKVGDVFMVKSGMNVARDGVIVYGCTEIDASSLTGESMPVYKRVGDIVNAGSLNINGVINVKVTTEAYETLLARITKLLSEAAAKKMPVARIADRVANFFVPAVIIISLLTFLVWLAFGNAYYGILCAISVLVISCPCALGLAVPISIVCAISNLAKNGVLVRNPEVLEIAKNTQNILFDKTGTITKGEISVQSTNLSDEILAITASLELASEHPIAKAIVDYTRKKDIKVTNFSGEFTNVLGRGIKSDRVLVGNLELLKENGVVDIDESEAKEFIDDGYSVILVAVDGRYMGYITLSDVIRDSVKPLIAWLKLVGIKSAMVTGDNESVANLISQEVGIDKVYAKQLPEDKFKVVKSCENSIFIGDGVNDALPLKEATIGVAMNSGSDIAKGAGDILLVNNDLLGVLKLLEISEKSIRVIKQNLFWAFFYNIICIPVAAGILYPLFGILLQPHFAALAMCFSSVTVVLNSLRLKFHKFKI